MGDRWREYEAAKAAYLVAFERLKKAKSALPVGAIGPGKADLMREAAIARDERIEESYRAGITRTRELARMHGVSPSLVRRVVWHIKHPEWTAQTLEWRAETLARIRAARGE